MRKVMLVAGLTKKVPLRKGYAYIGVDRGAYTAMLQQIPLLCAIGDFDSISERERHALSLYTNMIVLPQQKDETDSEAAIHYALEKGYEEIVLYGCLGGRLDHTMANLSLLMHREYPLILEDEEHIVRILKPGDHTVRNTFRHLSLLALEKSVVSESGVLYPLVKRHIEQSDIYTISNQIQQEEAHITIHSGSVLLIQSNAH